jgi:Arc/MetJ family transcription regulator
MRTNIEIDDKLMQAAMRAGGFQTKKETVVAALTKLTEQHSTYQKLLKLAGKVEFEPGYDYKVMRRNHKK